MKDEKTDSSDNDHKDFEENQILEGHENLSMVSANPTLSTSKVQNKQKLEIKRLTID